MGEIRDIKENPENYDDMVKKLEKRYERRFDKIKKKRGVQTNEELKEVAKKSLRGSSSDKSDYKAIKNYTIHTDSSSEEVVKLKDKLKTQIAQKSLSVPQTPQEGELRGRITY